MKTCSAFLRDCNLYFPWKHFLLPKILWCFNKVIKQTCMFLKPSTGWASINKPQLISHSCVVFPVVSAQITRMFVCDGWLESPNQISCVNDSLEKLKFVTTGSFIMIWKFELNLLEDFPEALGSMWGLFPETGKLRSVSVLYLGVYLFLWQCLILNKWFLTNLLSSLNLQFISKRHSD